MFQSLRLVNARIDNGTLAGELAKLVTRLLQLDLAKSSNRLFLHRFTPLPPVPTALVLRLENVSLPELPVAS